MGLFGMKQAASVPAISIGGPTFLADGSPGTWTASVTGGASPYRYQWSGMLSGTASTISGLGPGILQLDVWDSNGAHSHTQLSISVISPPDTCGTMAC